MKTSTLIGLCLAVGTASAAIAACAPAQPTMAVASPTASMLPSTGSSQMPTSSAMPASSSAPTAQYKQVERLARPAINEGLITQDALLNTWNSVGPSVDLTDAAKPIAAEATKTLMAFGNDQATVNKLFGALLPDVMRIDTTHHSGYAGTKDNPLGNVEPSKGIPVGGRLITDDVIDVTLLLIVPDATAKAVPGLRSDNVAYADNHKPVMADFPYVPQPW